MTGDNHTGGKPLPEPATQGQDDWLLQEAAEQAAFDREQAAWDAAHPDHARERRGIEYRMDDHGPGSGCDCGKCDA